MSIASTTLASDVGVLTVSSKTNQLLPQEKTPSVDNRTLENAHVIDLAPEEDALECLLEQLPVEQKELLMVASCLGLDEEVLSRSTSAPTITIGDTLDKCVERKLIVSAEGQYAFASDEIRQVFYSQVCPEFNLTIGRKLLKAFSSDELEKHVFVVLNQLRRGEERITSQKERYAIARLSLMAAKTAVQASNFRLAAEYLDHDIGLLNKDCWEDEYELSLDLHCSNAEVLYAISDFDQMNNMIQEVLGHSREFRDQLRAWYVRVLYLGNMGRPLDAIKDGSFVLSQLGETLRSRSKPWIAQEFLKVRHKVNSMSDGRILRLPRMTDLNKLAAMQMYNMVYLYAFFARTRLSPIIVLRMMRLSLKYGLCEVSSVAFAMYGLMVKGVVSDGNLCCRLSDLGLKILQKFQARAYLARVYFVTYGATGPWRKPVRECLPRLFEAYRTGIETGDKDFALFSANKYCILAFGAGLPLQELDREIEKMRENVQLHQHNLAMSLNRILGQTTKVFMGQIDYKEYMSACAQQDADPRIHDAHTLPLLKFISCLSASSFGYLEFAERLACDCYYKYMKRSPIVSFQLAQAISFFALVLMTVVRTNKCTAATRRSYLRMVRQIQKRLRRWILESPTMCCGKLLQLEAEMSALKKDFKTARVKYTLALGLSKSEDIKFDVANQGFRAGLVMYEWGDMELSKKFFREAHAACVAWGALGWANYIRDEANALFPRGSSL